MNVTLTEAWKLEKVSPNKGSMIPMGYWAKGHLNIEPEVNGAISLSTWESSGNPTPKQGPGWFQSSRISDIKKRPDNSLLITTANSSYLLTPIPDETISV